MSAENLAELWRQVVGVLGLFDTVLQAWVYPVLTVLLLATFFTPATAPIDAARPEWRWWRA